MGESLIQVISGALGVVCFAILYNVRGRKLLCTAFGGALSWILFLIFKALFESEALCCFFVSTLISVYSEILARKFKTPTTTFIIPSLIPLIPGSSLYYTIASAFEGSMDMFFEKLIDTLKLASSLALGIIIVSVCAGIILKIKSKTFRIKKER